MLAFMGVVYMFYRVSYSAFIMLNFDVRDNRVEDLCYEGLKTCYFLDFIGPKGFAVELWRRTACE